MATRAQAVAARAGSRALQLAAAEQVGAAVQVAPALPVPVRAAKRLQLAAAVPAARAA
jgi:hypothetical protein